jgi:hypothetical protein
MLAIPVTVVNTELSGIITEAFAAVAYKTITPVLYDVIAKTKYARDAESADMVDIIIRNRVYDIAYVNMLPGVSTFVRDLLVSGSNDVASLFAKNENAANIQLNKIVESYKSFTN